MKKFSLLLALAALSAASQAAQIVYSNIPATGTTGLTGSYGGSALAAGTYLLAEDDYTLGVSSPSTVSAIRWVGGSTLAGTTFIFQFLDANRTYVGGFQYAPSSTGNAVRSLTGIDALNLTIPSTGFVQIGFTSTATAGIFVFGSTNTNTVGSSDVNVGTFSGASGFNPARNMAFEITATPQATPEPSAFAALGLGAVAVLRRRKRA